MDECSSGSPCSDVAVDHKTCQNTDGGFACVCVAGFALDDMDGCEGKFYIIPLCLRDS